MPRLSVDIDLTWLPIEPRAEALANISAALGRIALGIRRSIPDSHVHESRAEIGANISKLVVQQRDARIKIEPNPVIRGAIFPAQERDLCPKAQSEFELFVSGNTLSVADLFGGKICAAMDRQHPRDLFDIKLLFANEGLTDDIRKSFIVYLASHDRPMHELIDPVRKDITALYKNDFLEMTDEPVAIEELLTAREELVRRLSSELTDTERRFILSLKNGMPEWNLMDLPNLENLPAIRWKLANIGKITKAKREEQTAMLRDKLKL